MGGSNVHTHTHLLAHLTGRKKEAIRSRKSVGQHRQVLTGMIITPRITQGDY